MERKYYMVRAMDSSDMSFSIFTKSNVVAVGWSRVDFTQYDKNADLRKAIESEYYGDSLKRPTPSSLGKKHAQMQRFCEIKKDDYIIVPYHNQILLAVATGEPCYSETDKEADLANQHKVEYCKNKENDLRKVLRVELSEGLQRRLRMLGSAVINLIEFRDEIDRLFQRPTQSYESDFTEKEDERINKFKESLIENICTGKTRLPSGGRGLEELIRELLECDGFDSAKILPKNSFPEDADADIYAVKTDIFLGEQKYLFQVKHHRDTSDDHGIRQLIAARNSEKYFADHLVFITTATLDQKAQKTADSNDIIYMDGTALGDWIYANCSKLSAETRVKLNISLVPKLI